MGRFLFHLGAFAAATKICQWVQVKINYVSLFKNIGSSLTYLRGFLLLLLLKTISFNSINRTCLLCLRPSINKYLSPLDLFSCFSSLPYLNATLCLVGWPVFIDWTQSKRSSLTSCVIFHQRYASIQVLQWSAGFMILQPCYYAPHVTIRTKFQLKQQYNKTTNFVSFFRKLPL